MRYEGLVYRPPSEANSLLIQCTIGCPHNKCTFCPMYKGTVFRIRPVEELKEDLRSAREYYGDKIETIFLPDGNTILMKTEQLLEILAFAREMFPRLSRVTSYGSARFINLKPAADLQLLREAGLTRIHSGMESGDDPVLAGIRKGATAAEIIAAGLKVKAAGMELSEYVLIGIGGRGRSCEHAAASAAVLNAINPDFIRLRTYIPIPGTPLYEDYRQGRFDLLSPHEALRETAMFIEHLDVTGQLFSDHNSNYAYVNGRLPMDKQAMLAGIDKLLAMPEAAFRSPEAGGL
ncbi:radical SAM protein [Anaeroselena agilis]|uniref:Radical SAM protein n=1 Tax=Anaeroselena agilis TaxID=3063788 RepID=A0ABU3P318_9FIRM|nr:radical SAM protein [Selenomonadales bacterium 4137-cl]